MASGNYQKQNYRKREGNGSQGNRSSSNQKKRHRENNNQQKNNNTSNKNVQILSKTETSNDLLIFIVFLISLATFFLVRKFYLIPQQQQRYGFVTTPQFMKEGKLSFLNGETGETIVGIDIEVAKTDFETERGLMNRRSLPANAGMLFVFEKENYRTFWMKDTYLSLDILFLNEKKEVIRIAKEVQPLSMASIPSGGKAKYVVEVLAGFSDANNIRVGDRIEFRY